MIRDISSDDILVGNKRTNFREIAERELRRRGGASRDIRAREVRGERVDPGALSLRATPYASSVGSEIFLELTTAEDRLAGFLRLSLPTDAAAVPRDAQGLAMIRELHVYGASQRIVEGARNGLAAGNAHDGREPSEARQAGEPGAVQHRGFGRALLREAERRAAQAGYAGIAVISAVGTRAYYRREGYQRRGLYQAKPLELALREDAAARAAPPA